MLSLVEVDNTQSMMGFHNAHKCMGPTSVSQSDEKEERPVHTRTLGAKLLQVLTVNGGMLNKSQCIDEITKGVISYVEMMLASRRWYA